MGSILHFFIWKINDIYATVCATQDSFELVFFFFVMVITLFFGLFNKCDTNHC